MLVLFISNNVQRTHFPEKSFLLAKLSFTERTYGILNIGTLSLFLYFPFSLHSTNMFEDFILH